MKILFLCTAHNSLSQRLYLALSTSHSVTIEYALSDELVISAVAMAGPDLIICPFLTTLVPKQIYDNFLTLIVHPGPPGDIGPSALDWVLMGDDGSVNDANELLRRLDGRTCQPGRSHWGVTILQAIEEFDAGAVWAFDQFPLDIDTPGLTKSELYRGPVTEAAVKATLAAVSRVQDAAYGTGRRIRRPSVTQSLPPTPGAYSPALSARAEYGRLSVTDRVPFLGGKLHHRPLLKASQRDFDLAKHTSQQISRRIRCADSQPGVLSKVFGPSLYVYGGIIDGEKKARQSFALKGSMTNIRSTRNGALCIETCDGKGIWITHIRRPKSKTDKALWPKIPATSGLIELGVLTGAEVQALHSALPTDWSRSPFPTFQEVWVEIDFDEHDNKTAYLHFDFYNGAMSTDQCSHLLAAMEYILTQSTARDSIKAVVLMGGAYFSNGIALNVIEAAADPAQESWRNINRIDDVVRYLLHEFPSRHIFTVAAVRGNAAAGGVALAAACDVVIAGHNVVLNPAYRATGLFGSEYHTLSYYGRCGAKKAKQTLRDMTPLSPSQAQAIGLVDYVFPGAGADLDERMRWHVRMLLAPGILAQGFWKARVDLSPSSLARARGTELAEMSLDFWSARSVRYHSRRYAFVRKVKPTRTPLRFATHRRLLRGGNERDEEETDAFDDVEHYARLEEKRLKEERKAAKGGARRSSVQGTRRRPSLAAVGTQDSVHSEGHAETLFACYYRPIDEHRDPTAPQVVG